MGGPRANPNPASGAVRRALAFLEEVLGDELLQFRCLQRRRECKRQKSPEGARGNHLALWFQEIQSFLTRVEVGNPLGAPCRQSAGSFRAGGSAEQLPWVCCRGFDRLFSRGKEWLQGFPKQTEWVSPFLRLPAGSCSHSLER